MKTFRLLSAALSLFFVLNTGFAQTDLVSPVVRIHAADPNATWAGDPALFVVSRDGPTNATINVGVRIEGSALNGADYAQISQMVSIPAGIRANSIRIQPINKGQTDNRTVELTLVPPPTMPPVNFVIGNPSNAVAIIRPTSLENHPPYVKIFTPTNYQVFRTETDIPICAEAADPDANDYVAVVEFFAGTHRIAVVTNNPVSTQPRNPFCVVWSNAPAGEHVLRAKAVDSRGAAAGSQQVVIKVGTPPPGLPVVTIVAEDPHAVEPGGVITVIDGARFVVSRSEGTNQPLEVFYQVNGTAFNGEDYVKLPGKLVIPVGAFKAPIFLNPLADTIAEGIESVLIKLESPACIAVYPPPPGCYRVGVPGAAEAYIADPSMPPTNSAPAVRITSPPNGAIFHGPIHLPLFAYAADRDGVASVEFFAGTNSVGLGGPVPKPAHATDWTAPTNMFFLMWSNAPFGQHLLTALATDKTGLSRRSESVKVSVVRPPPPPTNRPVLVSVIARDPLAYEAGANADAGPKNASFLFRRLGSTNDPVRILFRAAGTASNGVDYVELPESIVIPAGEPAAILPVIPINDAQPELRETVIIRLKPSTNSPVDYVVTFPAAAAAVIYDNDRDPVRTAMLSDRSFHLNATGTDGTFYRIEHSTDLINWTELCTSQAVNGTIDFIDPDASATQERYYRAVPMEAIPFE